MTNAVEAAANPATGAPGAISPATAATADTVLHRIEATLQRIESALTRNQTHAEPRPPVVTAGTPTKLVP